MSVPLPSESTVELDRVVPLRWPKTGSKRPSQLRSRRQGSNKRVKRPVVTVVPLPQAKRPLWLKGLTALQTLSSGLALGTVGATLVVYGLTVQADRRLETTTATLRQLQRQEQQLTSAKAVLQHHLSQDAVNSQVASPDQSVIFLDPAIAPTPASSDRPAVETAPSKRPRSIPMGY